MSATPSDQSVDFDAQVEAKLIRRLARLAQEWPEGYMIASMGGTLGLFRTDDRTKFSYGEESMDAEKMLWDTTRIPNTGGDW